MNEVNLNDLDVVLAGQIPEATTGEQSNQTVDTPVVTQQVKPQPVQEVKPEPGLVGQKLLYVGQNTIDPNETEQIVSEKKLTRIGEKIGQNVEFRDGWIDVPKDFLGDRAKFYPENWEFRIRPATVDAIRNWSILDEESANSIDDVFNEIVKSCFQIRTMHGLLPWGNLRSWDRFFILMLIRQYSFVVGESKIQYTEDCPECDNGVTFVLDSTTLRYDLPDPEVMKYYDRDSCTWMVDPAEFDVEGEPIVLYLPTLEKEANIKAWIIDRIQNKKKVDTVFIKFLPWMAHKISKDTTIASRQIKELELKFKSFDTEMFSLMNDIINNIMVAPSTKLITTCPTCGEEVTANIRFPNGVRELFDVKRTGKKFGKK